MLLLNLLKQNYERDMAFGNYSHVKFLNLFPFKSHKMFRLKRALMAKSSDEFYASLSGYFSPAEVRKLVRFKVHDEPHGGIDNQNQNKLTLLGDLELHSFLSRNFVLLDKGTMHFSLEGTVPLASKNLLNSTRRLSILQHLFLRKSKKILRFMLSRSLHGGNVYRPKRLFHLKISNSLFKLMYGHLASVSLTHKISEYPNMNEFHQRSRIETPILKKQLLIMLSCCLARYA